MNNDNTIGMEVGCNNDTCKGTMTMVGSCIDSDDPDYGTATFKCGICSTHRTMTTYRCDASEWTDQEKEDTATSTQ